MPVVNYVGFYVQNNRNLIFVCVYFSKSDYPRSCVGNTKGFSLRNEAS